MNIVRPKLIIVNALLVILSAHTSSAFGDDKLVAKQEMPAKVYDQVSPVCVKIKYDNDTKSGSGVIVGYSTAGRAIILTACHIVASNYAEVSQDPDLQFKVYRDIKVKIGGASVFISAYVVLDRLNLSNDVALIATRNPVSLGQVIKYDHSEGVKPGQKVAAFGFPSSDELTQTVGVVTRFQDNYLVFDAKIAPGSSGGPLVDKHGRMIGLSVLTYDEEGFALSMNTVLDIVDRWLAELRPKDIWQRQQYTSFWQKLYKQPIYVGTEILGAGTGVYLLFFRPGEKIFGEPPGPPGEN